MTITARLLRPVSILALTFALGVGVGIGPSRADTAFDGAWWVKIVAENGDCRDRTVPIKVSDGRISFAALGAKAEGTVTSEGRLEASVSRKDEMVTASGLLDGETGHGRWVSPTDSCEGSWTASKA
jgi:hypothetical protein